MKLKSVKLIASGFGGMKVKYLRQEEKNGRMVTNEIEEKRKWPIHLGLENKFKELRPFLLELCKVLRGDEDKLTKDFLIQEIDLTALQIVIDTTAEEGTGFILEGTTPVLNSKELKFKTPKIESGDGYDNFDAVQLIIKEIVKETEIYMRNGAVVTDQEVLIRYIEKSKDDSVNIESIKNMSPEEQKELLSKILEDKFGCVILSNEEMEIDPDTDITENLIGGLALEQVKEETFDLNEKTEFTIPVSKSKEKSFKKA